MCGPLHSINAPPRQDRRTVTRVWACRSPNLTVRGILPAIPPSLRACDTAPWAWARARGLGLCAARLCYGDMPLFTGTLPVSEGRRASSLAAGRGGGSCLLSTSLLSSTMRAAKLRPHCRAHCTYRDTTRRTKERAQVQKTRDFREANFRKSKIRIRSQLQLAFNGEFALGWVGLGRTIRHMEGLPRHLPHVRTMGELETCR